MDKVIINSYEDFEKLVGQEIGVSDYVEVSQERINLLPMQHWIISGFTWIQNVQRWKVLIRARLCTVILRFLCFRTCGIRL